MSSGSISFLFCTSWCNWYRIAKEIISKFDLEKGSKPGILPIGMYLFWSSWSTFTGVDGLRDPQDILYETRKLVPQVITAGELAEWNQQNSSQGHPLPPSIY